MRICLCDDDPIITSLLITFVDGWAKDNVDCSIYCYSNAESMLFDINDSIPFDLLILDIQMDKMNGLELAKRIRKIDSDVPIAFLTGNSEYVFSGYEVAALRYLLKPVKQELFNQVLYLAYDKLKKNNDNYTILTINKEAKKIFHKDINFIEAQGHYLNVHTNNQTLEIKMSLNELEILLNNSVFIKCHRSFLVNISKIKQITKTDCILDNDSNVPISRNNYQQVNQSFIKYWSDM